MYKKGRSEVRNPSKWITEFYIPLLPKAQPVREYIPSPQPSTDAAASAEPLPAKNSDPAKAKKKVESKNTVAPKAIEEEFEF